MTGQPGTGGCPTSPIDDIILGFNLSASRAASQAAPVSSGRSSSADSGGTVSGRGRPRFTCRHRFANICINQSHFRCRRLDKMPVPDYQSLMLPLLMLAGDGKEHVFRDAVETLADQFDLSDDDRRELIPSGTQPLIFNRVGWARTYMKKAGLLESRKRGYFNITARGRRVLAEDPHEIDAAFLRQFPEFVEWQKPKDKSAITKKDELDVPETPEEQIGIAFQQVNADLANDLLETVKGCTPLFFERLVVDLLVRMGYGGTRQDAGQAIGKSGDEGIDGIIKEDRLGLDIVYIQAKKWEQVVSRPEIQKFAGALQGKRARKGIFITTSAFTANARQYVSLIDSKIVLIDGVELAQLMIDHNIGVNTVNTYELKRIDSDYFSED
jgi:restriction system protein